jgi:hypothetical protein
MGRYITDPDAVTWYRQTAEIRLNQVETLEEFYSIIEMNFQKSKISTRIGWSRNLQRNK